MIAIISPTINKSKNVRDSSFFISAKNTAAADTADTNMKKGLCKYVYPYNPTSAPRRLILLILSNFLSPLKQKKATLTLRLG